MQTSSRRKRDGHKEEVGEGGRGRTIDREAPLRSRKGSYAESVVNLEEVLLDRRRRRREGNAVPSPCLSRLRDSITVTERGRGEGEKERERGIGRDGIHASASPSSRPR